MRLYNVVEPSNCVFGLLGLNPVEFEGRPKFGLLSATAKDCAPFVGMLYTRVAILEIILLLLDLRTWPPETI